MMPEWTIAPLVLGTASVDTSLTLLHRDPGVPLPGAVLAWLLLGENMKIVVDTGPFSPTRGMDPLFSQTAEQTLQAQLNRFDASPDEIAMVVNTHLHTDHCSGNAYFRNCRCLVQKCEMEYARDPLPVDRPAYAVDLDGIDFQLLDGDTDIAPGLRLILTPGHTPGSQSVLVQTSQGLYIIAGDTIPHFANMAVPDNEPFWPSGAYIDLREFYHSLNRLKALGGTILPSHDLIVLKHVSYP